VHDWQTGHAIAPHNRDLCLAALPIADRHNGRDTALWEVHMSDRPIRKALPELERYRIEMRL
jgi:hypothetical protein